MGLGLPAHREQYTSKTSAAPSSWTLPVHGRLDDPYVLVSAFSKNRSTSSYEMPRGVVAESKGTRMQLQRWEPPTSALRLTKHEPASTGADGGRCRRFPMGVGCLHVEATRVARHGTATPSNDLSVSVSLPVSVFVFA